MSPKKPSQSILRLTSTQLKCNGSDSVAYSIGSGMKWYAKQSVQKPNKFRSSPGIHNRGGQ